MMRVRFLPITLIMTLVANVGYAGGIKRFVDSQGVLHISNVETAPAFESRSTPEPIMPGGPLGTVAGTPPVYDPVLQKGSWEASQAATGEIARIAKEQEEAASVEQLRQEVYAAAQKLVAGAPAPEKPIACGDITGGARLAHPVGGGAVVCYTDPHGVIHITSRGAEAVQAPVQMAAAAPGSPAPVSQPNLRLTGIEKVAWAAPAPATAPAVPAAAPPAFPEAGVHRYRDSHGVWRITNTPRPILPGVRLVAAQDRVLPGSGAGFRTIVAQRDWRGICHIFNHAAALVRDRSSPMAFLGKLPPELEAIIVEAARRYRLPVPLVLALIRNESNFASQAISPKGAMGLMQLMPGTAQLLGVQDPFSPQENVHGGCRYLRSLLDSFQGSVPLALAAYNAGPQRVIAAGYQVPQIKETRGFVTQVMALYFLLEKLAAL